MKIIGRLLAMAWAGLMLAMVGAALGAVARRQNIVPVDDAEADEVHLSAIFEPLHFEARSSRFRGGQVDLWYGGGIIDLRGATLDPSGAHLDIRAIFGGCQIAVPAGWNVTTNVRGIGGAGDGRPQIDRPADAPRLTIEGTVFFGGFGISSDVPDEATRALREAREKRDRRHVVEPAAIEPQPVMS